jgi:hypothetical protein
MHKTKILANAMSTPPQPIRYAGLVNPFSNIKVAAPTKTTRNKPAKKTRR